MRLRRRLTVRSMYVAGKVFVFGGTRRSATRRPIRKVDVYDPALEAWSTLRVECDLPLALDTAASREEVLVHAWWDSVIGLPLPVCLCLSYGVKRRR